MNKVLKRIIIALVVTALICGGIYGGLSIYRKSQVKPVAVYSVSDVVTPAEYYLDDNKVYGSVYADRMQSVFISGTQNVHEVLVKEGQTVKKGDPLMTYDTTLTQIQLEKEENALAQQELALSRALEDLEVIKRLVPSSDDDFDDGGVSDDTEIEEPEVTTTPEPTPVPVEYSPEETGVRISGKGTYDNPYVYLWSTSDALTNLQLLSMFTKDGQITLKDDAAPEEADVPVEDADVVIDDTWDVEEVEFYDDDEEDYGEEAESGGDEDDEGGEETGEGQEADAAKAARTALWTNLFPITVWGDEGVEIGVEAADESDTGSPADVGEEYFVENPDEYQDDSANDGGVEIAVVADEHLDDSPAEDDLEIDARTDEDAVEIADGTDEGDGGWVEEGVEEGVEEEIGTGDVETEEPSYLDDTETEDTDVPMSLIVVEEEPETTAASEEMDYSFLDGAPNEVYVILEMHENDNRQAPVIIKYGLHLIRDGHNVAVRLFNPNTSSEEEPETVEETENTDDGELETIDDEDDAADEEDDSDLYFGGGVGGGDYDDEDDGDEDSDDDEDDDSSIGGSDIDTSLHYSAKEIAELRKEKEKDIRNETLAYKLAEVNLKEIKLEMSDGTVRSKINGVVKTVRDPNEAYNNSEAVVVVSGGGGYQVNISVSELDLDSVYVGQDVEISSFDNDSEILEGQISSISDFPASNADFWSSGNPNASFYPCVINASEDAEMRDGDYVGVQYSSNDASSDDSFYLDKMFVRSDSTGRYVYKYDQDGSIKKTYLLTGKSPDSYIVQVKGGLTENDYIAFPYGSNIEDGAPAEKASIDDLYSY